ncbi:hypothetical protein [Actinoallomurus soli]|uniref:hypothetical protein n=1 Tax=Actinoallomurus soli TaxID=2952535 RepID=UPI0020935832|nr:hypothetical protein [Actinoallomurus soli]MCO5967455.1 hypothetical protein [Actinoallomurus soli]
MASGDGSRDEILYLAAGLADLVTEGLRGATRRLPGLSEVRQELRARGELAVRRSGPGSEAHLEVLARHVVRRSQDG